MAARSSRRTPRAGSVAAVPRRQQVGVTRRLGELRRVPREIVGVYWDSGVVNDVPALAWFLLTSLVPLALGITALAAVVLGDYAQAQALASRISGVLPSDVHDQIVAVILRTQHESPLLLAGSIAGMVWVSSGAVGVIERCLARLLARPGIGLVLGKVRNLALAASVTTLIVLMVAVASAGTGLVGRVDPNPTWIRIATPVLSVALTSVLCAGVYRALAGGCAARPRGADRRLPGRRDPAGHPDRDGLLHEICGREDPRGAVPDAPGCVGDVLSRRSRIAARRCRDGSGAARADCRRTH